MRNALPALLLLCVSLAACDATAPQGATSPAASVVAPPILDGDSLQWQARLACADCDGIETRLQLQRVGPVRSYVLTEVYSARDGDARFTERGQWQQRDALLRLRDEQGARRAFAVLPDGRLQPLDWHGRALSERDDDFLLPVADAPGQ